METHRTRLTSTHPGKRFSSMSGRGGWGEELGTTPGNGGKAPNHCVFDPRDHAARPSPDGTSCDWLGAQSHAGPSLGAQSHPGPARSPVAAARARHPCDRPTDSGTLPESLTGFSWEGSSDRVVVCQLTWLPKSGEHRKPKARRNGKFLEEGLGHRLAGKRFAAKPAAAETREPSGGWRRSRDAVRGPEGRAAADRAAGVTGPGPEGRGVTRRSARQTAESKAPAVTPVTVTPVTVTTMRTVPPARACAHEPAAAEKPARVCTDGGSPGPRPPPADGELRGGSPLPGLQDPRGPPRTPRPPAHPAPSTCGHAQPGGRGAHPQGPSSQADGASGRSPPESGSRSPRLVGELLNSRFRHSE